ncbi:YlcG family protein [Salmonella enterica subsp. enterica serovar Kirkee]|uniref:Phage antitermination protein Q n=1 Tax=Salmonella enterica I TaxID=59201 RepID=A0A379UNC6_SALET|nr:YlcG family protein [Salmonella enterica subsp. enterica serovar Kirkee]EDT6360314.1 YlcG family protein [Salmonella enterica subsp. enterica serovar Kirkee]EEA7328522.1 YlcG family protein [Salmonella enterica subsp. enterica serovar Kirkee]SUG69808.1 phage antitermination protein Q [Salmonella enterica subsp. enterica]
MKPELIEILRMRWQRLRIYRRPHWLVMRSCFIKLDSSALIAVTRSRSQQKATNYVQSLAKPN